MLWFLSYLKVEKFLHIRYETHNVLKLYVCDHVKLSTIAVTNDIVKIYYFDKTLKITRCIKRIQVIRSAFTKFLSRDNLILPVIVTQPNFLKQFCNINMNTNHTENKSSPLKCCSWETLLPHFPLSLMLRWAQKKSEEILSDLFLMLSTLYIIESY